MTRKATNLAAALAANKDTSSEMPALVETQTPVSTTRRAPSRAKQTNISVWFDIPVKLTLDELRVTRQKQLRRRVTNQELVGEAFNDLFKKYGFPEVVPTKD